MKVLKVVIHFRHWNAFKADLTSNSPYDRALDFHDWTKLILTQPTCNGNWNISSSLRAKICPVIWAEICHWLEVYIRYIRKVHLLRPADKLWFLVSVDWLADDDYDSNETHHLNLAGALLLRADIRAVRIHIKWVLTLNLCPIICSRNTSMMVWMFCEEGF